MGLSVNMCVTCMKTGGGQKRTQIPGNRSYSDISHLLGVLETEPGSSARVTSFLNWSSPYYPSFLIRMKFYDIPEMTRRQNWCHVIAGMVVITLMLTEHLRDAWCCEGFFAAGVTVILLKKEKVSGLPSWGALGHTSRTHFQIPVLSYLSSDQYLYLTIHIE